MGDWARGRVYKVGGVTWGWGYRLYYQSFQVDNCLPQVWLPFAGTCTHARPAIFADRRLVRTSIIDTISSEEEYIFYHIHLPRYTNHHLPPNQTSLPKCSSPSSSSSPSPPPSQAPPPTQSARLQSPASSSDPTPPSKNSKPSASYSQTWAFRAPAKKRRVRVISWAGIMAPGGRI